MKITGLPALSDNYIWVIQPTDDELNQAWVVDAGEAQPVIDFFHKHQLKLAGILLTHHHYDHINGIAEIMTALGQVPVISNSRGPYKGVTDHVEEGSTVTVFGETFNVLDIPGHTHEHVAFYHPEALFCGDVLFTAGCGRTWTQSPKPMAESLLKLRDLDDSCTVYCGHDYTFANINFAAIAEPDNADILRRRQKVHSEHEKGIASVPETLRVEKDTNPFLRFNMANLKQTLLKRDEQFYGFEPDSDANLYASLRGWKDALDKTGVLESS